MARPADRVLCVGKGRRPRPRKYLRSLTSCQLGAFSPSSDYCPQAASDLTTGVPVLQGGWFLLPLLRVSRGWGGSKWDPHPPIAEGSRPRGSKPRLSASELLDESGFDPYASGAFTVLIGFLVRLSWGPWVRPVTAAPLLPRLAAHASSFVFAMGKDSDP